MGFIVRSRGPLPHLASHAPHPEGQGVFRVGVDGAGRCKVALPEIAVGAVPTESGEPSEVGAQVVFRWVW